MLPKHPKPIFFTTNSGYDVLLDTLANGGVVGTLEEATQLASKFPELLLGFKMAHSPRFMGCGVRVLMELKDRLEADSREYVREIFILHSFNIIRNRWGVPKAGETN